MSSALSITRSVGAPRAAFVDFPLGHTTGRRGDAEQQRALMIEALAAFHELEEPGGVKRLPFRWSQSETWKREAFSAAGSAPSDESGDRRTARSAVPQYQNEEDRRAAQARHREGSCECCVGVS